jgi:glutathionyl-hydroquinone reductase
MTLEQTLQNEIEKSKELLYRPIDNTIYRHGLAKRIAFVSCVVK